VTDAQAPPDGNGSRWSRRPCCCFGCLTAILLLLIPAWLAFTPSRPPAPLPPAEVAKVDASIAEKRESVEKLSRDLSAGKRTPFTLVLREAEINRMLETDDRLRKAMRRANIERAWVKIEEGRVNATAIPEGGPSMTVTVAPEIDPRQGLRLNIEGVEVGRLGVGAVGALRKTAQKAVSKMVEGSLVPRARFESVRVEDGAITLTGSTK
jgi:hypothetical protein